MSENSDSVELKDLKQQIKSLAMIMKGATVGNIKPKKGNGPPPQGKRKCLVILLGNPLKVSPEDPRGLELVPQVLLDLAKPMKCYCCDGWGDSWHECPTLEILNWRELI